MADSKLRQDTFSIFLQSTKHLHNPEDCSTDLMTKRVEIGVDFLRRLETDVAIIIFKCLDDPADLVRASLVSRYWCNFVVSNELSKQLSVAMFPQLSNIAHVVEIDTRKKNQPEVGCSILYREHKVYASLMQDLRKLPSVPVDCVMGAYTASSTNNLRYESMIHTWDHRYRCWGNAPHWSSKGPPHWSSKGQKDPNVPETLMYMLKSDLCVITEISIQPFEDVSQPGNPIYSSKSVRFRMGHPRNHDEIQCNLPCDWELAEDKFIWTYTSEEFPMSQENRLQHFKLQEPVLCVGGFLEIQMLGRVQRKETDGLFYICVYLVKAMGHSLPYEYGARVFDGKLTLAKWILDDEDEFCDIFRAEQMKL